MTYSVVIPAFNAEETLAEALRSVLSQTSPPELVIVIDDGSSDGTADVARAFGTPVRCLRQENAGPGAATTHGFALCSTGFVAMLDADDLWLPHKASTQLATLCADPSLSGVFSHIRPFRSADDRESREIRPGWLRSTMMLRRTAIERIGPMVDPPGRRGELVGWLAQARHAGERFLMSDEVLALRRIRDGSLSSGRDPARDRGYIHAARQNILRRRAEPQ